MEGGCNVYALFAVNAPIIRMANTIHVLHNASSSDASFCVRVNKCMSYIRHNSPMICTTKTMLLIIIGCPVEITDNKKKVYESFTFLFQQTVMSFAGVLGGPLMGIFCLGLFTTRANSLVCRGHY